MVEPLSDDELARLRLKRAEEDIAAQRERVARLKAEGKSSQAAEELLSNLVNSFELSKARLARLTGTATVYLCFLMKDDDIGEVRMLECANDADALAKATALLQVKSEYQAVEIWTGKRSLGLIPRR
jgi:hypothetical protein